MLLKNKKNTSAVSVTNELKDMNSDLWKRINQFAKTLWLRIIKKPRQNKFLIVRLSDGKIQLGKGFTLDDYYILCWYYYLLSIYQPYRIFRLSMSDEGKIKLMTPYINYLNNNPFVKGHCKVEDCLQQVPYSKARPEIYKVNKYLQRRARLQKLLLIKYPYQVIQNKDLFNSYIILDRNTGELLGKEGWHTWHEADVEDYLDKLESGEIVR